MLERKERIFIPNLTLKKGKKLPNGKANSLEAELVLSCIFIYATQKTVFCPSRPITIFTWKGIMKYFFTFKFPPSTGTE